MKLQILLLPVAVIMDIVAQKEGADGCKATVNCKECRRKFKPEDKK